VKLRPLLEILRPLRVVGSVDREWTGIAHDSRAVGPGFLFAAVRGGVHDGRDFIGDALRRGAVVVLGEDLEGRITPSATFVEVENVRQAMAEAAGLFHDYPSRRIDLVGITGTNGKTTTAYLVRSVLESAGRQSGLIGTVEYVLGDRAVPALRTTPESVELQGLLARMCGDGADYAVMEVSSHALELERVHGCEFRVGVFTNLTQDHLDFHGEMERYYEAKRRLFGMVRPGGAAVVNVDDPWGRRLAAELPPGLERITYGIREPADLEASDLETTLGGSRFELRWRDRRYRVEAPLLGEHNVSNMLAAFGVGMALGIPVDLVLDGITELGGVPGRFERVDAGQDFLVLLDYAHTPDALEHAIRSVRSLTEGRVITVFGCGGERDRGKRPRMGDIATALSDYVVLTSDNPRGEAPGRILEEIRRGVSRYNYLVLPDREEAIRRAVGMAGPGDVVLIAGKGHEQYQEVAGVRHPFSDREAARRALEAGREDVRS